MKTTKKVTRYALLTIATVWICVLIGMTLLASYLVYEDHGLWAAIDWVREYYSPWNIGSFITRIIEVSPALFLLWVSDKLKA